LIDHHILSRLAFIRYGYQLAIEQSSQPEPMCTHALMGFHDSVELYLQLACEHLGVPSQPKEFMAFWSALSDKMPNKILTQKIGMERINKARVGFKHYGNMTPSSQIQEFQAITELFFEENTPPIFGISFREISMVDLVHYESARVTLKLAQTQIAESNHEGAMCNIAIAYRQLIDELNEGYFRRYHRSPFFFGQDFTFDSSFFRRETIMPGNRRQEEFEDKLIAAVGSMQPVSEAMSLGLDFRKFAKFSLMRPVVLKIMGGGYKVQIMKGGTGSIDWPPSKEACQFSLDFVIESAVKMRNTDINTFPGKS
jgi:hypothetical protein